MRDPMLSVLMPVHDGEAHLGEAMKSILAQSFEDFELVVLDDGSTDGSADVVRSHDDPRIRLVRNEENLGLARTLNRGLGLARGRYVARMDADDVSLPRRFERQAALLESRPDVGVCGTWLHTFGTVSVPWKPPADHDEIVVSMLFQSALMHPTVMMRRSLFDEGGAAYDETLAVAQDYALWQSLATKTRFANLPEVLLRYRIDDRSEGRRRTKERQREVADGLRRRYLERLAIPFDEAELALHNALARRDYEASVSFLARSCDWLTKIVSANALRPFASPDACRSVFTAKLYDLCHELLGTVDGRSRFAAATTLWGGTPLWPLAKLTVKGWKRRLLG